MKAAWLTDLHYNFLSKKRAGDIFESVDETVDCVFLTGDISEGNVICRDMKELSSKIPNTPIYFVLGNHDFYRNSVENVRYDVALLNENNTNLRYLTSSEGYRLTNETYIIGVDAHSDCRYDNGFSSRILLNDFYMINEYIGMTPSSLITAYQRHADQDAEKLENQMKIALKSGCNNVIVLTHIPPFREAAIYNGEECNEDYMPWFSCQATGDVLMTAAYENTDVNFNVYCGHTHERSSCTMASNLKVHTGNANYNYINFVDYVDID